MNKTLQEYTSDFLPRSTAYTKQKLKDQFASFRAVEELFVYTIQNGQDVLQSIEEYEELGIKSTQIEHLLNSGDQNHSEWKLVWEENQKRLEDSLKILKYLQEISQVIIIPS